MTKKYIGIISIVLALIGFSSCKDQKTYIDYLKDQSKAIDAFIAKNNITVLDKFPADSVFKPNEFYLDELSGVYYNIIDRGDLSIRPSEGDEINIRFRGLTYFMTTDSITFDNLDSEKSPTPAQITYRGALDTRTRTLYQSSTPGWMAPAPYIGKNGKVKMIVPFNMGSQYDRQNYQATYYEQVEYTQIHKSLK